MSMVMIVYTHVLRKFKEKRKINYMQARRRSGARWYIVRQYQLKRVMIFLDKPGFDIHTADVTRVFKL